MLKRITPLRRTRLKAKRKVDKRTPKCRCEANETWTPYGWACSDLEHEIARRVEDRRKSGEAAYFLWLKTQNCALTGTPWIDRSHIRRLKYGAGMGKKPRDWFAIPLSLELHRELHQHGDKTWEAKHGPQEALLWATWEKYGLDKIPEDVRRLATVVKEPHGS